MERNYYTHQKRSGLCEKEVCQYYSPDLNPQENVWAWAEHAVRKIEDQDSDNMSFNDFKVHVLKGCKAYTGGGKLVPSMATRMGLLIEAKGGMIKY